MSVAEVRLMTFKRALEKVFSPSRLEIYDDSALHHGHIGAENGAGHYRIAIISSVFKGKSRIEKHRLVYDALKMWIPSEIHALTIDANNIDEI